jgi:hypothetical protein
MMLKLSMSNTILGESYNEGNNCKDNYENNSYCFFMLHMSCFYAHFLFLDLNHFAFFKKSGQTQPDLNTNKTMRECGLKSCPIPKAAF